MECLGVELPAEGQLPPGQAAVSLVGLSVSECWWGWSCWGSGAPGDEARPGRAWQGSEVERGGGGGGEAARQAFPPRDLGATGQQGFEQCVL